MSRRPVPLRAISALFLKRQHLSAPRAARLTASRLGRFVEDVGGIQMDSINVLERAHYLTVWSRFGPYDRARLDRLSPNASALLAAGATLGHDLTCHPFCHPVVRSLS